MRLFLVVVIWGHVFTLVEVFRLSWEKPLETMRQNGNSLGSERPFLGWQELGVFGPRNPLVPILWILTPVQCGRIRKTRASYLQLSEVFLFLILLKDPEMPGSQNSKETPTIPCVRPPPKRGT